MWAHPKRPASPGMGAALQAAAGRASDQVTWEAAPRGPKPLPGPPGHRGGDGSPSPAPPDTAVGTAAAPPDRPLRAPAGPALLQRLSTCVRQQPDWAALGGGGGLGPRERGRRGGMSSPPGTTPQATAAQTEDVTWHCRF